MAECIPIAHIRSGFPSKFGIPRQSGIVENERATIVFEKQYRDAAALRGLETFSHLWLLWEFSEVRQEAWSPTVRPPRLGGNTRVGVFATRSPYRPNPIGMSCVALERIELDSPDGPVIHVLGADLMDGTPIYDVKPYLPFTDSRPNASAGFTEDAKTPPLCVRMDCASPESLTEEDASALLSLLAHDPRPAYQNDSARVYGMEYKHFEIKFSVADDVLTVIEILERMKRK